jgi:hypothetical protein
MTLDTEAKAPSKNKVMLFRQWLMCRKIDTNCTRWSHVSRKKHRRNMSLSRECVFRGYTLHCLSQCIFKQVS